MSRSFSNAKILTSALVEASSSVLNRRGFAAAAPAANVVRAGNRATMAKQVDKEGSETSPWVPDPVTGYYRPENRGAEIDVAELRRILLNQKTRQN